METISMSAEELKRLLLLRRVRSGELNLTRVGELLGLIFRLAVEIAATSQIGKQFVSG